MRESTAGIRSKIHFKRWTYPLGISPMIDTAKFAFILAPYEIAVPAITCCLNKRGTSEIINSCLVLYARNPVCSGGKTWKQDTSTTRFSPPLSLPFYPCNSGYYRHYQQTASMQCDPFSLPRLREIPDQPDGIDKIRLLQFDLGEWCRGNVTARLFARMETGRKLSIR